MSGETSEANTNRHHARISFKMSKESTDGIHPMNGGELVHEVDGIDADDNDYMALIKKRSDMSVLVGG